MQNYILYEEFITLGQVLKELGLVATGGQAKLFLAENEGQIFVNGELENRRGKKLRDGDKLEIPEFDVTVVFESASAAEMAEFAEEKAEKARVAELVKKMNAENKAKKPVKQGKPRFPGGR